MAGWIKGTVVHKKFWNPNLLSLSIRAPVFAFTPGQFVRIALTSITDDMNEQPLFRAYSLVNKPGSDIIEFLIAIVPGGSFTSHLVDIHEEQTLLITQPASGFFTLNDVPTSDSLWMMSTGTGLGPFLSMLDSSTPWSNFDKVVLVHAVRHANDLCYQDRIAGWKETYGDQFHYQPVISRELAENALHGHIPQLLKSDVLEKASNTTIDESAQIMLCGNPHMIKDTREVLTARGLNLNTRRKPGNVTIEQYWKG